MNVGWLLLVDKERTVICSDSVGTPSIPLGGHIGVSIIIRGAPSKSPPPLVGVSVGIQWAARGEAKRRFDSWAPLRIIAKRYASWAQSNDLTLHDGSDFDFSVTNFS